MKFVECVVIYGRQVTVNVWDWSGDPVYEAVLLPLLGYRGVYLLVFDASEPLEGPATVISWTQGQVRGGTYGHGEMTGSFI